MSLTIGKGLVGRTFAANHVLFSTYESIAKNLDAPYPKTDGSMLVFAFGEYWKLAGAIDATSTNTTNAIWRSPDLETWEEYAAFDPEPPTSGPGARFYKMHWFWCDRVMVEGVEYIYTIGGDESVYNLEPFIEAPCYGYQTAVWRWRGPGFDWEMVLASADTPWAGTTVSVGGQSPGENGIPVLWVFGGQNGLPLAQSQPTVIHNWLFKSVDAGFTWTMVRGDGPGTDTWPSPRGLINRMPFFKGEMMIVAGGTYDAPDFPNREYFQETWSFSPADPSVMRKRETPPFKPNEYNNVEVANGLLWNMNGYGGPPNSGFAGLNSNYIWNSPDGDRWIPVANPIWDITHAAGTCVRGRDIAQTSGNGDTNRIPQRSTAYLLRTTRHTEPVVITPGQGTWSPANVVLDGPLIESMTNTSGPNHDLIPVGDKPPLNASDPEYGDQPSALSAGSNFLQTEDDVNLQTFTLHILLKPYPAAPGFYPAYSIKSGEYFFVYVVFTANNTAAIQVAWFRDGKLTQGTDSIAYYLPDIAHVLTVTVGNTADETYVMLDGQKRLLSYSDTADFPPSPYSGPLAFYSAPDGSGGKVGSFADARLYPVQPDDQVLATLRDFQSEYPYEFPSITEVQACDPDFGPNTGGTSVLITVSDSTNARAAYFDGVEAPDFAIVDPVTVSCTTPPGTSGSTDVQVLNVTGLSLPVVVFAYT